MSPISINANKLTTFKGLIILWSLVRVQLGPPSKTLIEHPVLLGFFAFYALFVLVTGFVVYDHFTTVTFAPIHASKMGTPGLIFEDHRVALASYVNGGKKGGAVSKTEVI